MVFSLWNESVLNPHLSNNTRVYFLSIIYEFFKQIYVIYKTCRFDASVKFQSKTSLFVCFMQVHKIVRIINTLVATINEIVNVGFVVGLDRIGSHVIENYIGKIRYLCNADNRYETVLYNLARYEFIMHESKRNYLQLKEKRENPGGCQTRGNDDGASFCIEKFHSFQVAYDLLVIIGLKKSYEGSILNDFIVALEEFSNNYPYKLSKVSHGLRSINIVNSLDQQNKKIRQLKKLGLFIHS